MTQEEQAQLQANSDSFQSAIGQPAKTGNGIRSGFLAPGNSWWLEADIRPDATYLKVNTLNAAQLYKLVSWLRHDLDAPNVEEIMTHPDTRYQLTMGIEVYNVDKDFYDEHPNWTASIGPVYDNLEAAAAVLTTAANHPINNPPPDEAA